MIYNYVLTPNFYRPRSEGYVFTGICLSNSGGGEVGNTKGHNTPPPRTRSQHLPPPPPLGPGHNTSGQHLPPPYGQHLPPPLWTTPPSPLSGQHLPLPPGTMRRRAVCIYWNAFLLVEVFRFSATGCKIFFKEFNLSWKPGLVHDTSSGSSGRVVEGPRNVKSRQLPLVAIFLWLIFTGRRVCPPPPTRYWIQTVTFMDSSMWNMKGLVYTPWYDLAESMWAAYVCLTFELENQGVHLYSLKLWGSSLHPLQSKQSYHFE